MNVLVTLNSGLGNNLGPNFVLTSDIAGFSQVATLDNLLNGIQVIVPEGSTKVVITSVGVCTNNLVLNIISN